MKINTESPTIEGIIHRWGPGKMWRIYTEDGDLDGYVRAADRSAAMAAAADQGTEGDYTVEEEEEDTEEAMADLLSYARRDVDFLLTRMAKAEAEIEATNANNCGQGDPPSAGWRFSGEWWCRGHEHRGPWLLVRPSTIMEDGWVWVVTTPCCPCPAHAGNEWPEVARGTARSARAAMRMADAAAGAS